MGKVFEDYLSDIQKDMVSICLEYANYKVDKVFVYASNENNVISSDCFFEINHSIVKKSKLKEIDSALYDTSAQRQIACLKALTNDIKENTSTSYDLYEIFTENELQALYTQFTTTYGDDELTYEEFKKELQNYIDTYMQAY